MFIMLGFKLTFNSDGEEVMLIVEERKNIDQKK